MRSLPLWKCLNTSTPFSWFEKYDRFFTALAYELGFESVETSEVGDIGDSLYMVMKFTHKEGKTFTFTLLRGYHFSGGGISLKLDNKKTHLLMTASYSSKGTAEDRTSIGNWFIEQIRDNWDLV